MRRPTRQPISLVVSAVSLGGLLACGGSFDAASGQGSGGSGGVAAVGGSGSLGGAKSGGSSSLGGAGSTGGHVATGGTPGQKNCVVGNIEYPSGSSFPAPDGCNTCSCANGSVVCTLAACVSVVCGGFAGSTCAPDEYCAYAGTGLCGAADASSTCAKRPQVCPDIFDPVCACDGKTYPSACAAAAAGVGFSAKGECRAPGSCTIGNNVYADGTTNIPAPDGCNTCSCVGGVASCTEIGCPTRICGGIAGAACLADEYCDFDVNTPCTTPDAAGTCKKRPQVCALGGPAVPAAIAIPAGVCGCDGMTYFSECAANGAGTDIVGFGVCPVP
ncbi:MAG: Kazal-type serine protease inhibitor domain-containing protein [Polyangiaceae bacterium]|nr:Kazal-type serine protease inhibitor domain-containing protein [Polyangiaceae bacterium]